MGDLDDFFAKKDKKGKAKSKVVAANLFDDKKKESEAKKEKLKKKQDLVNIEQTPAVLKKTKEDDDWEDFDDPSDLNLEGLKVVNLADGRGPDGGGGGGTAGDAEGGGGSAGGEGSGAGGPGADDGPWRRKAAESADVAAGAATAPASASTAEAASTAAADSAAAGAAESGSSEAQAPQRARYEPPHKRSAAAAVTGGGSGSRPSADLFAARPLPRGGGPSGRRDKNAPNINDVEEFPTLATGGPAAAQAGEDAGSSGGGGGPVDNRPFESVRELSRYNRSSQQHQQQQHHQEGGSSGSKQEALSVNNRWAALGEDAAT